MGNERIMSKHLPNPKCLRENRNVARNMVPNQLFQARKLLDGILKQRRQLRVSNNGYGEKYAQQLTTSPNLIMAVLSLSSGVS